MEHRFGFLEKPSHCAAISAFTAGMFVHLFGLVHILHNYDSIQCSFDDYGSSVRLGRWLLELLGKLTRKVLGGSYNLSWFNGAVFILLLAVCAYFLTEILEIQHRKSAVLIGTAFVTFPTVVSTLFFPYTVVYYGVGVLLAVLAVWVMLRCKYGFVLTVLLTACSLGIYQAYFPLTAGLFVLYLLKKTLSGQHRVKELFFRGVTYCTGMLGGIALYFALMHLSLKVCGISLSDYQNISQMGKISLSELPGLVLRAFIGFFTSPAAYDDGYRLALIPLLQIAYVLLLILSAILVICTVVRLKKTSLTLFAAFLCLMFPIAVNLIVVMSSERIYTLMVYPFVLVLILPIVLWEILDPAFARGKWNKAWVGRIVTALLVAILLCNSYFAEFNYTALYYANRQTENYVSSLVTQIRMTDGFRADQKWALIGTIDDPLLHNEWMITEPYVKYGGNASGKQLLSAYSMDKWIEFYVGCTVPAADHAAISALKNTDAFQNMPCWPDAGSIRIIRDMVVVKFQES